MNYYLTLDSVKPTNLTALELISHLYSGIRPMPITDEFYENFLRVCEHPNILFKHPLVQLTDLTTIHSLRLPMGTNIPEGTACDLADAMVPFGGTVLIYRIIQDNDSESGFQMTLRILSSATINAYLRPILIDDILADLV